MRKNGFDYRVLLIFLLMIIFMFGCVLRLYNIGTDGYINTRQYTNTYRIKLSNIRGSIFDKNLNAITNSSYKLIAVVSPTPLGITAISAELFEDERLNSVLETLKSGKPAVVEINREIECDAIKCVRVYSDSVAEFSCPQLIGYTDSENHGASGIEAAFDELLFSEETLDAVFATDSLGRILSGAETEIIGDTSLYKSGVALTIDNNIQKITDIAMSEVECGAAVVMEIGSGKIRAMVSRPTFNIEYVDKYLDAENSPLVNRALSPYNVGSAFKPCVAAALIENGNYNKYRYNCSGSVTIDEHKFNCHNLSGHGIINLKEAITLSCNVFFYNSSIRLGAEKIYNMATKFSFGKSIDLGGISTASGSITERYKLEEKNTALANFSIGQGELLLSPVSILTLYEAIANDGVYYMPTLIEGTVEKGVLKERQISAPTKAISSGTAKILKEYLVNVVESGTGTGAKPEYCTAAGKTATAQTGWKKNGEFIQNSWFCGFFPVDDPKYAVAIIVEDEANNGITGAPIFKKIADGITQSSL